MEAQLDVSVLATLSREELVAKIETLQIELDEIFDSYCDMREAAIKSDLNEVAHNLECQDTKRRSLLIARLGKAYGLEVGVASDGPRCFLCVDLPSGQIYWMLAQEEIERLETEFGRYEGKLEACSIEDQQRRIENPGF